MRNIVVILAISLVWRNAYGAFVMGGFNKQARFDRFEGTCPGNTAPIAFICNRVQSEGNEVTINSTIISKEDLDVDPMLTMRFERCKSRENLDSCEEFYVFKADSYCTFISEKNKAWSDFFGAYNPRWKCPIRKGMYHGINNKLDMSALLLFPIESWVWRITGNVIEKETNRFLICIFVEARVLH